MRLMIVAATLFMGSAATAQEARLIPIVFEWPAVEVGAIPDLRLRSVVQDAKEAAREAKTRASEGRRLAARAKRREGIQSIFGIKPSRATSDDETQVSVARGRSHGMVLGGAVHASGGHFTGALGANEGVYIASADSPLYRFSGFVWGAATDNATPSEGIFEWKNGDTFTGSIVGDGSASRGIYIQHGGERKFVGIVDLSQTDFRPIQGYMESASGELLAVVRDR
jgi:hypothetical protein